MPHRRLHRNDRLQHHVHDPNGRTASMRGALGANVHPRRPIVKILVTTASKHGATAQIGTAIAEHLTAAGHEVDVREPDAVRDLVPRV
jgi:hypothetical protein